MALVRWNPWSELFDLHSQMDQLFGQVFSSDTLKPNGGGEYANLPVDIRQTDGAFLVEASVPGFRPDDVEVTVDNGVLTIRGRMEAASEDAAGGYIRRERRMTSLFRQIGLPQDVRTDEISASFENGVLTVTLPRSEKPQPKRIPVSASGTSTATVVDNKG